MSRMIDEICQQPDALERTLSGAVRRAEAFRKLLARRKPSLVVLVAAGQNSREEVVSYFGELFRGKLVRRESHVWNQLISSSAQLYPAELIDAIRQAYEDELVDPGFISWDDIEQYMSKGKAASINKGINFADA